MSREMFSALTITRTAAADVPLYRLVSATGTTAAAAGASIGVSQQPGKSGDDIAVSVLGVMPVEAGAAVTAGALLQSDANGRVIPKTAEGIAVARALNAAGGAGEFVQCILIPN